VARSTRIYGWAFFFAAVAAGVAGCESPIPPNPTFEIDVKPIFFAHCVRCHGAGGTLNNDPRALNGYATDMPGVAHLDFYADQGDCTPDAQGNIPVSCERGAKTEVTVIGAYIHLTSAMRMPLAPAPPLDDWELKVIDRWIAQGAPD
jgi:hypothetical protein